MSFPHVPEQSKRQNLWIVGRVAQSPESLGGISHEGLRICSKKAARLFREKAQRRIVLDLGKWRLHSPFSRTTLRLRPRLTRGRRGYV